MRCVLLTVVLLSLEFVDGGDLAWHSKQRISCASLLENLSNQMLLAVVSSEDADATGGVTDQSHVHVELHDVLRLAQILIEERCRRTLAHAVQISNVDHLELVSQARVAVLIGGIAANHRQVAERLILPVPEIGQTGSHASLRVELNVRHAQSNEAREQALIQMRVLLERTIGNHGRKLMVITQQDHALEPGATFRVGTLQQQRDECFNLKNLR